MPKSTLIIRSHPGHRDGPFFGFWDRPFLREVWPPGSWRREVSQGGTTNDKSLGFLGVRHFSATPTCNETIRWFPKFTAQHDIFWGALEVLTPRIFPLDFPSLWWNTWNPAVEDHTIPVWPHEVFGMGENKQQVLVLWRGECLDKNDTVQAAETIEVLKHFGQTAGKKNQICRA